MLYSMTGFGSGSVLLPSKKLTVDIKSLNSKQLDMNCRVPGTLRCLEPAVRSMVASKVERGKVDFSISVEYVGNATTGQFNGEAMASYKAQLEEISREHNIPLPAETEWFGLLLRLPEVLTENESNNSEVTDEVKEAVLSATGTALTELMAYRRAEGKKLEEFFAVRIERIRELLSEVPRYESERIERIKSRMRDALSKIPAVEYDKGRFEQELIYYIEKLDVTEEKQRLSQHLDYFIETMNSVNGGQGKKLGFIAQEMTREINTLGSKSNDAEMQNLVVRMKDELEQIKEQVLNVM